MGVKESETSNGKKTGRKWQKRDNNNENDRKIHLAGITSTGNKYRFWNSLQTSMKPASYIKDKLGNVSLVDVKKKWLNCRWMYVADN